MARLKAVRVLQEKAAEQDLVVARLTAKAAANRLQALDARQAETRQMLRVGLERGDMQVAYLCMIEEGLRKAIRPAVESEVVDAQDRCERTETAWLHARREHAAIFEIVQQQCERVRNLQVRAAQRVADELYRSGQGTKERL